MTDDPRNTAIGVFFGTIEEHRDDLPDWLRAALQDLSDAMVTFRISVFEAQFGEEA